MSRPAPASSQLAPALLRLAPVMTSTQPPAWSGAEWVGLVELEDLAEAAGTRPDIELLAADGYANARLLVREGGRVRGFVTVEVDHGRVSASHVLRAAGSLPAAGNDPLRIASPPVTVVLCTRDRADQLAAALESVRALDYARLEIIVVDNAPTTSATADHLNTIEDPRLRIVTEPRAGLSRARNTGLRHATGQIVAFTDDDVVVDPDWITRMVDGFARAQDVVCVTGLVPSGELREPVQAHFDQRVTWANSCGPVQFRLSAPPVGVPLFPFQGGIYGTGANFALRRDAAFALGGFDEALGVGSPTGGGEDIDMFVRVVTAGYGLAYEPSAIVWHRHRADAGALTAQAIGYGTGLGAWLTKVALDRRLVLPAARRAVGAARRVTTLARPSAVADDVRIDPAMRELLSEVGRVERRAIRSGPWRYANARRTGAARPLRTDAARTAGPAPERGRR